LNKALPIWSALLIAIFCLAQCQQASHETASIPDKPVWWNHADSVGYVGIETCKSCHYDIYQSYRETGMGRSFGRATAQRSAMDSGHTDLFDSIGQWSYRMHVGSDGLFLRESRSVGTDTLHRLSQKVDYIIGSGQHTNSHLMDRMGYIHQMPFTYYTQNGVADLPPGFENGFNERFDRPIGLECMSCHNAMPTEFVAGSTNKFSKLPEGIDCERCHGPGAAHVRKIMSGSITDTAKEADPSIVNPKRLTAELRMEICQRCHLQGNSVLQEGKSFFDFKPGMKLASVLDVYMPRTQGDKEEFIMAGHVQRFRMSACFLNSDGQFVCTSCHDPHVAVAHTDNSVFNSKCMCCHGSSEKEGCTEQLSRRRETGDDCSGCHMPLKGSADIPHVRVHDHYIRIPNTIPESPSTVKNGLYAVNNPKPSRQSRIRAYLQQYERFDQELVLLDSVEALLSGSNGLLPERIHLKYLRADLNGIIRIGQGFPLDSLLEEPSLDNAGAWTAFRLAMAWKEEGDDRSRCDAYFQEAIRRAPFVLEFRSAYAGFLVGEGRWTEAADEYTFALDEDPQQGDCLNGLGYVRLLEGRLQEAEELFSRCLHFAPDHVLARINRLVLRQQSAHPDGWRSDKEWLERYHADHPKVRILLDHLGSAG
jgi:hypothetical protein